MSEGKICYFDSLPGHVINDCILTFLPMTSFVNFSSVSKRHRAMVFGNDASIVWNSPHRSMNSLRCVDNCIHVFITDYTFR